MMDWLDIGAIGGAAFLGGWLQAANTRHRLRVLEKKLRQEEDTEMMNAKAYVQMVDIQNSIERDPNKREEQYRDYVEKRRKQAIF